MKIVFWMLVAMLCAAYAWRLWVLWHRAARLFSASRDDSPSVVPTGGTLIPGMPIDEEDGLPHVIYKLD